MPSRNGRWVYLPESTHTKRLMTIAMVAASLLSTQLNAAHSYTIDPAHTRVGFSAWHFGINTVKGKFNAFTGKLVDTAPAKMRGTP